jgi:hypothetical protein
MRITLLAVMVMAALVGRFARADDEPSRAPATGAKPPAKAEREEMAPVVVVRSLLRRLAESKDKDVYDGLMADAYRKAHSLDAFVAEAEAVRGMSDLGNAIPSVEGWVLLKPAPGQPRAASLTAGWREAVIQHQTTEYVLCLRLVESDGRWRVTEFRRISLSGRELYDFHDPIEQTPTGVKGGKCQVTSLLKGTIVKMDDDSFVVKPGEKEGEWFAEPDRAERTIRLDGNTTVWKGNFSSDGGQTHDPGTRADLKVGSEVWVNAADDTHHADHVEVILRAPDGGPGL